ncbi:hypothetical protein M885DRAFT_122930 [Pelagophyceae sp. CCMP2097]|nr:hypothetical protein M885DRAFT_122930 [Pelagophyceae sp. CCMP2097]
MELRRDSDSDADRPRNDRFFAPRLDLPDADRRRTSRRRIFRPAPGPPRRRPPMHIAPADFLVPRRRRSWRSRPRRCHRPTRHRRPQPRPRPHHRSRPRPTAASIRRRSTDVGAVRVVGVLDVRSAAQSPETVPDAPRVNPPLRAERAPHAGCARRSNPASRRRIFDACQIVSNDRPPLS